MSFREDSIVKKWLLIAFTMIFTTFAHAEAPIFQTQQGALRGYDPVAYFTLGEPTKGKKEFRFEYLEATWYFANAEHLQLFKENPEKYAPQYGGYCAYAMSKGHFATTIPYAWTIHDDKLYMNYSIPVWNTWRKNIPGYLVKSDRNWQKLKPQKGYWPFFSITKT